MRTVTSTTKSLLLALVLLGSGAAYWRSAGPTQESAPTGSRSGPTLLPNKTDPNSPEVRPAITSPAMASEASDSLSSPFSSGDPFGRAYAALVAAARTGEAGASISLAKGLKLCATRPRLDAAWARFKEDAERLAKQGPEDEPDWQGKFDYAITAAERAKSRRDHLSAVCAGLPKDALADRWRYQLAAAQSGDAESIMDFLEYPAIDPRDSFRSDDHIRSYRNHAPGLLEKLIAQGDLRGYEAYVRAGYDQLMNPDFRIHDALSRVLKPDPVRVLAFDIALGRSGLGSTFGSGPNHDALRNRQLDGAQVIQAESLAQQLLPAVTDAVTRWRAAHPPGATSDLGG